jgi:putative ABC transport system permease protein
VFAVRWIKGLLRRHPGRVLLTSAGIAVAVGLLASIGAFLDASRASMTRRSTERVAVDWQVQAAAGADPSTVRDAVAAQPGVEHVEQVWYATTTGLDATIGGTTQTTGPGVILGLPADYPTTFPETIRPLLGAPSGVLLAQQTAANLHAAPGDTITIGRAGLPPAAVVVAGVVDLPDADAMFQTVGAPPGSSAQAPPDNVVIVPDGQWHDLFDPLSANRPELTSAQTHARLTRRLPSDPTAAFTRVTRAAHNLDAHLAGSGTVADNLAAALDSARVDALDAQLIFLFLGVPGAALALVMAVTVASSARDRRRREQALLRTRGARRGHIVRFAAAEAGLIGALGAIGGLVFAALVGRAAFRTWRFGTSLRAAGVWAALAVLVSMLVAFGAIALPAWRDASSTSVVVARRPIGTSRRPWWARAGVDVILLVIALVVFRITTRAGYQLVLAPEGVPSISVNMWALAGPALFWIGASLLVWRLTEWFLRRGRPALAVAVAPLSGPLAGTVAASLHRQRRLIARGAALVAMAMAFALSTAVFNSTYRQQSRVDALLSNGADVTVTASSATGLDEATTAAIARTPGVRHVEAMQHRYAYVGSDLQDLYGVDPSTIVDSTRLQDAYFQGGTARNLMDLLSRRPDGILVSAETVSDYQLQPGDALTLRLQDASTHQYVAVPFHYLGIAKEFPTAPSDSFLVANHDYVAKATGSAAANTYLVDTGGHSIEAVASALSRKLGVEAKVNDLATNRRIVGSSLTAVDLRGLTRVELGFAVVLTAAATGLVLWLGLAERRTTFAIASALGANPRQLGAFIWSEAAMVTGIGLALGVIAGDLLSIMLVRVLTGIFDPPPAHLAWPWPYLLLVAAVSVTSVGVAVAAALRSTRRPAIERLRIT